MSSQTNENGAMIETEKKLLSNSDPPATESRKVAIRDLICRHNDALINYVARRVRSRVDAHDIVQEAYARVFGLGDPSVVSHLRGYLYETARNVASNWIRSRIARETFIACIDEQPLKMRDEDNLTPERICVAVEELEAVKRAFQLLPPRTRMVLRLIKDDGLSYDEVAAKLEIKTHSVRRLVERALEVLLEASTGQARKRRSDGRLNATYT